MGKTKKCYAGDDYNRCSTELTWHHHGLAAKRELAEMLDCEFEEVENFRRMPEFDGLEDKMTDEIKLAHGWYIICMHGCPETFVFEEDYKRNGNEVICDKCLAKRKEVDNA